MCSLKCLSSSICSSLRCTTERFSFIFSTASSTVLPCAIKYAATIVGARPCPCRQCTYIFRLSATHCSRIAMPMVNWSSLGEHSSSTGSQKKNSTPNGWSICSFSSDMSAVMPFFNSSSLKCVSQHALVPIKISSVI